MKIAPLPDNEPQRIKALQSYCLLDTDSEQRYDDLTSIAAQICDTPIALISLVDTERQWFKSKVGLDAPETHRDLAFCSHAILKPKPFIIENTLEDERFSDNPLVTDAPNIRFYAGIPLITPNNHALGTLCVIDTHPKKLTEKQLNVLTALARQVVDQMQLFKQAQELELANSIRERLIATLTHDLKNSFQVMTGYAKRIAQKADVNTPTATRSLANVIENTAEQAHEQLLGMLSWAKDQLSGQQVATPVDALQACRKAIILSTASAKAKNIAFFFDESSLDPQQAQVFANEFLLVSTLHNLLTNSIKYCSEQDVITLRLAKTEGALNFEISDKGQGLSEREAEQLFNGKVSVSKLGTNKEQGSGMGTLLITGFVATYNGSIYAKPNTDGGLTVTLTLSTFDSYAAQATP